MSNRILIISDQVQDVNVLQEILPETKDGPFEIEWVRDKQAAISRLATDGIDIILMDFYLPDSVGIETFSHIYESASAVPIMTLVVEEDTELAREAVQQGAQGYLLKDHFHNALVPQALRNIIQRKQVEEALFLEKERATVTLESIADAVISTDRSGSITYMNFAAERMTGWSRHEAADCPIAEVLQLIDRSTGKPVEYFFEDQVARGTSQNEPLDSNADFALVRRDRQEVPIENSIAPIYDRRKKITGTVFVFRDVGPTQALMTAKMTYLAQHDALTDLPNRILLEDRLTHAISSARRFGNYLAVLFLDLDHFKFVNDSYGHSTGDQLLQSVARRLTGCIRSSDTVSRYGGDEFVIVLMEDKHKEDALHTASKVLAALALPHQLPQREFHTTASMGISVYPNDGHDAETLIKNADSAMYHAKAQGGNNCQFFNADMNKRALERYSLEAGLRHALEKQQFVLYYQPKVNFESGMITGVEALLRWWHPESGFMLPDQFVSIAEECGLIVPIGRWVLREACKQMKVWNTAGLGKISMAVNVSALEFRDQDYLNYVREILNDTDLDPGLLELELTETILMSDFRSSNEILQSLKSVGVKLVVDDFGTGYSSLSYLQEYPIDALKIDQSFVRGVTEAERNRIIVTSVIGMAANLKQRVVAEGVETLEQFEFLNMQHCEEGQGYFFSPPLDAERCTNLLNASRK